MSPVLVMAAWTLRRERGTWAGLAALLFLLGLLIVAAAQALDQYRGFAALAGLIPAAVRQALWFDLSLMLSFRGAIGVAYAHPAVIAALVAAAVAAGRGPAAEVDRRHSEFILSRPVPRWALVGRTLLVVAVAAVLLPGGLLAGTVLGLAWADRLHDVAIGAYVRLAAGNAALLAALGGVTALLASTTSRVRRATQRAVGFALVSYLLDYLAHLWEPLRPFGPLSVFRYAEPSAALTGRPVAPQVAVLLGVAVLASTLALVAFERRDG